MLQLDTTYQAWRLGRSMRLKQFEQQYPDLARYYQRVLVPMMWGRDA